MVESINEYLECINTYLLATSVSKLVKWAGVKPPCMC